MQGYIREQNIMTEASCGCLLFPAIGFCAGFVFSILDKLNFSYQCKWGATGAGIAAGLFSCFLLARLSFIPRDRETIRVHFNRSAQLYRECMRFGFFRPQEEGQNGYEMVEQNNRHIAEIKL